MRAENFARDGSIGWPTPKKIKINVGKGCPRAGEVLPVNSKDLTTALGSARPRAIFSLPRVLGKNLPRTGASFRHFICAEDVEALVKMSVADRRKMVVESLHHILKLVAVNGFIVGSKQGCFAGAPSTEESEAFKAEVERLKKGVETSCQVLEDALKRETKLKKDVVGIGTLKTKLEEAERWTKELKDKNHELVGCVRTLENVVKEHGSPVDLKRKLETTERALIDMEKVLVEKDSLIKSLKKSSIEKDTAMENKETTLKNTLAALKKAEVEAEYAKSNYG